MDPTNFSESIFCLVILISGHSNHELFWALDISFVDFNVMATQPFFLITKIFQILASKVLKIIGIYVMIYWLKTKEW